MTVIDGVGVLSPITLSNRFICPLRLPSSKGYRKIHWHATRYLFAGESKALFYVRDQEI